MSTALQTSGGPGGEESELESIESALTDVARLRAQNAVEALALHARWADLASGAKELRRQKARNSLDAYLAPVTFYSIEYAEEDARKQMRRFLSWVVEYSDDVHGARLCFLLVAPFLLIAAGLLKTVDRLHRITRGASK